MKWIGLVIFAFCIPAAAQQGPFAGILQGRAEDGLPIGLPLKETRVHLEVTGNILHAEVEQIFFNDTQETLEAVYVFPLPKDAAVDDMTLITEDRVIRSQIKEKQEARNVYEAAKSSGKRAALIEGSNADLFTTSLANFKPGEEVTIRFTFIQNIPFSRDKLDIVFPTTIQQRYRPRTVLSQHQTIHSGTKRILGPHRINLPITPYAPADVSPAFNDGDTDQFFRLTARIQGLPVADIISTTHQIEVFPEDDDIFEVALDYDDNWPDRDLVLSLSLRESEVPEVSYIQSDGAAGSHGLLTIYPPLDDQPHDIAKREIIFLVDTSGSMDGNPLEHAKDGLQACLDMLNPGDRFNIVRFSSDFTAMSGNFLEVNQDSIAKANAYIQGLQAGGGTEMFSALAFLLDIPVSPDYVRMVIFMTDGAVSEAELLQDLVEQRLGKSRIFAFGIGSAPNALLLTKLAESGRGTAQFIRNHDDLAEIMAGFFETVNAPVLTDLRITFPDESAQFEHYPRVLPDLYLGRPIQIAYFSPTYMDGEVEIHGRIGGREHTFIYNTRHAKRARYSGIEKSFGKAAADEMTAAWSRTTDPEEKEKLRNDIVATGLQYGLVTAFTSRVAVEEIKHLSQNEQAKSVKVPLATPQNQNRGYPATASKDPTLLFISLALALTAGLVLQTRRDRGKSAARIGSR